MPVGSRAFEGSDSKRRLEKLIGIDDLFEHFDTLNLIDHYTGKAGDGKHDEFPISEASAGAFVIKMDLPRLRHTSIILAGRGVAKAWQMPKRWPFYMWHVDSVPDKEFDFSFRVAIIPHPGGTNMHLNEPEHREACRAFLRAILHLDGN